MNYSELKNSFIDFFKSKGHEEVPSSSLIPLNDPTLLFTNAGMNQFKELFTGQTKAPYTKAVSAQKCVRAGGKHNDLDNVGYTARHHTFFEMLGNFSFGEYFKKQAIEYCWEYLTEVIKLPKEKLYVTVFLDDDEAYDLWTKNIGIPKDKIFRCGEKDNFWRMGDTGPCGPCSEIYFDLDYKEGQKINVDFFTENEDRFIEIWNLVFMQFNETPEGRFDLPKPCVDTGMGLERVAAILQGHTNNYDSSVFTPLINKAMQISQLKTFTDESNTGFKVLADHTRAACFLIADGVFPSNEGRGYVLRRILRRAIRFGHKIQSEASFLLPMAEVLIEEMKGFYPELFEKKKIILQQLSEEEAQFKKTLQKGQALLSSEFKNLKPGETLPSEVVFKLYDTYGFPSDLTEIIAKENNFKVSLKGFETQLKKQKELSKKNQKFKSAENYTQVFHQMSEGIDETKFTGYTTLTINNQSPIALATLTESTKEIQKDGFVIFAETPFYPEGGGQVSDLGKLQSSSGEAEVLHSYKYKENIIHQIKVTKGSIKVTDTITLKVEPFGRHQSEIHHTVTHVLHACLRKTLGTEVQQAGSYVGPDKLRFDFNFSGTISSEQLDSIEDQVNAIIQKNSEVTTAQMSLDEAQAKGALCLFEGKYQKSVRVIDIPGDSLELCGGTHVSKTGDIQVFKILSETGISKGVRRIEALAGPAAVEHLMASQKTLNQIFKENQVANKQELSTQITKLKSEVKKLKTDIKNIIQSGANSSSSETSKSSSSKYKFDYMVKELPSEDRGLIRDTSEQLKKKHKLGACVVIGSSTEKGFPLTINMNKDSAKSIKAGDLFKELSNKLGGKGGGRPDFAQGMVEKKENLEELIKEILG